MTLIAEWTPSEDCSMELPRSVWWNDGRPASIDDYIEHSIDTHILRADKSGRIEMHIFPDVVADVVYDRFAGSWVVKDCGFGGWSLGIADPAAKDDQLIASLYTLPVVYRVRIHR